MYGKMMREIALQLDRERIEVKIVIVPGRSVHTAMCQVHMLHYNAALLNEK